MIRINNKVSNVMEFTTFKKKENVTDDELISAILKFETSFLAHQEGVIFHCLVRNHDHEYANVLFAEHMDHIKQLEAQAYTNKAAQDFFDMVQEESTQLSFHTIAKENFKVPSSFSCIEYGSFALKAPHTFQELIAVSHTIETHYLNSFSNTKAHFISTTTEQNYAEVTFGATLGQTKQICSGYTTNEFCKPLLAMADETSMHLDFWYVIA